MTGVAERPTASAVRVTREYGANSTRTAPARLTALDQAARIRHGNMIESGR